MEAYAVNKKPLAEPQAVPAPIRELLKGDLDTRMYLYRHIDEVQARLARLVMADEVVRLCGAPYERDTRYGNRYKRWGPNPGSIRIRGQRGPVRGPRVRNMATGQARPLETYRALHRPADEDQDRVAESILLGLSQRDYHRGANTYADSFGFRASSVSRTFQERSAKALEELEQRNLATDTYVALLLDGKFLQDRQIVLGLGLTADGSKKVLGFVEPPPENADAVQGLLQGLIDRGLRYAAGLLCIIDGAKGLRKAIQDVFGPYAQVQRCTGHKRENVGGRLKKKEEQVKVRRRLQAAYRKETYTAAKAALMALHAALQSYAPEAANSLTEGLEETLTLHKLGVATDLGRSLQTTNLIENVNSRLGARTRRVKRWMNSDQRQRWGAMALRETEPRLCKLPDAEPLPKLQKALSDRVPKPYIASTSNRLRLPQVN